MTDDKDVPVVHAPVTVIADDPPTPGSIAPVNSVQAPAPTSERRHVITESITTVKSPLTLEAEKITNEAEVLAAELRTQAQRKVNFIWEFTQSFIAIAVTLVTLYVSTILALAKETTAALLLSNAFFLVIGFYFGRTNHQTRGGPGTKEPLQQSGR